MNPFKTKSPEENDYESFTIFDSKARTYREPLLAKSSDDMLRQVTNLFRDPAQNQNVLVTNPEDFSLFKIGEFSTKTGKFTPCTHEHLANLHDLHAAAKRLKTSDQQPGALSST